MSRRRAVIAGGAGFVGSHLCERLLTDGYDVTCIDNLITGRASSIEGLVELDGFDFIEWDITKMLCLSGTVDIIFNLASPASPTAYLNLPVETLLAGALGSLHALELAKMKNCRYIFASTSEVYGNPDIHPQSESYWGNVNPVGPRAAYDEAKRYGEALATAYREHREIDTAIVRIFNTYGPRMRPDDGRVVPTFIRQANAGESLTVSEPGTQTRSLCYIDDLIEALIRTMDSSVAGPINLGNPREVTMMELAALIIDLCASTSRIEFVPSPCDDPMRRCPDITVAQIALGWTPKIDLASGLARTIEWFRSEARN